MSNPAHQPNTSTSASGPASASSSTPAHQYQPQPQPSSYYHQINSHVHNTQYPHSASSSSASGGEVFTKEVRNRQGRGKDPYTEGDVSEEDDEEEDGDDDVEMGGYEVGSRLRLDGGRLDKEDYSKAEKRQKAVAFLDTPELLMMYAQTTGQTISAARLHFMKMLCGYDDEGGSSRGRYHGSRSPSTPQRGGGGRA